MKTDVMKVPFNDLSRIHKPLEKELMQAIRRVMDRSWYIQGEESRLFERNFARYLGAGFCIGCGNGTDALEIIFRALGLGAGDEVIAPANTYVATAEAIVNAGARPVFADVDPVHFTIVPEEIERLINARTKAVVPVHLFGCPADMEPVRRIAHKYGLFIVEDCAQAHGAMYKGERVGALGDAAAFSFYPTKNLGALGDGGAIITNDKTLAEKCRMIANHGQAAREDYREAGRNSRLDELQAAVLNVKLSYLDQWNGERAHLAAYYSQKIKSPKIKLPACPSGSRHSYHLFVVQTSDRDGLVKRLNRSRVQTLVHYPEILPDLEPFRKFSAGVRYPTAGGLAKKIVSIPLFPGMREEEADRVVSLLF